MNQPLEISTRPGDGDGQRRDAARRPEGHGQDEPLHAGSAAEHSVGARPVGHHRAVGRRGDGPPERRRQRVGAAVELRRARRGDGAAEVEHRRRRRHGHERDGRFAGLLRLRRLRRDADLDRRRGRLHAVAGRRRQPGDEERHGQAPRVRPVSTSPTRSSSRSTSPTSCARTASTGNPIQNIKDYGFEVGGPIKKGRAWIWGSNGKQDINVGINNFYKADAACQAMKTDPLSYSLEDIRDVPEPGHDASEQLQREVRLAGHARTSSRSS